MGERKRAPDYDMTCASRALDVPLQRVERGVVEFSFYADQGSLQHIRVNLNAGQATVYLFDR